MHHTPDFPQALAEIRRVLKDGGRLWMTVYHRQSIFYAVSLRLDHLLRLVEVRKLTWQDMPGLPYVYRLWQYVPKGWLESLGRRWGWYLIVRAVKTSQ